MTGILALLAGGGGDPEVELPATTISVYDFAVQPGDATTAFEINTDGNIYEYQGGGLASTVKWLNYGTAGDYSVRLTTTDTPSAGSATNTWLALTSHRSWQCNFTGPVGIRNVTGTLEIARTADTATILDSASVDMTAEVDSGL